MNVKKQSVLIALVFTICSSTGFAQALDVKSLETGTMDVVYFDVGRDTITVPFGKSLVVSVPDECETVSIANPEVCDISMISATEFILVGLKPGQTNIHVFLRDAMRLNSTIIVSDDTLPLKRLIETVMPYEKDINVAMAYSTVVLSGYVEKATSIEGAQKIAEAYMEGQEAAKSSNVKVVNMLKVLDEKQILLEVRLAEVTRISSDDQGFDFRYIGDALGTPTDISFLDGGTPAAYHVPTTTDPSIFSVPSSNGSQGTSTGGVTWDKGGKQLAYGLDYLVSKGLARFIAKPNLLVANGEEASFLAGGEFPVPVESDSSISIEWKEFGVKLTFRPQLDERDIIHLSLTPEVSVLDFTEAAVSVGGVSVPALKTRRTDTKVALRDGESFYVAGLISQSESETFSKMPGISSVPIIGKLFKKKEKNDTETELIVFVTPRIVSSIKGDVKKDFNNQAQMQAMAAGVAVPFEDTQADTIKGFIEQGEIKESDMAHADLDINE